MFDIICRLIVNTVRKIAVAEVTDVKYAAVCRSTRLVSSRPWEFRLPSQTCEIRTTEDASPKFSCLVLRNARRLTSPDYLPNLLATLDYDGNADSDRAWEKKSSWDKLFQVISVEKRLS